MGKSTTAQMFRDAGIPVWDADSTVHQLYSQGGAAVKKVQAKFPTAVTNGVVSRQKLKEIIADDLAALAEIEAIVHPLVAASRAQFRRGVKGPLAVFDIPLLFETKADDWLDSVLVVTAPTEIQKQRVLSRPDMTESQFEMINSRQIPDSEKKRRATHLIETKTKVDTEKSVRDLIEKLSGEKNA